MTLTFDQIVYTNLLVQISPKIIETEDEYDRSLTIAERLTFNKNKTPEERAIYQLLVMLIEAYETKYYALPVSKPHEVLQHSMDSSGTKRSDLVGKLGNPEVVSQIISGDREMTIAQAQRLGDMFKVSPQLFI
jgi:HTH-type transcriptional regulator / antitoxin HigA